MPPQNLDGTYWEDCYLRGDLRWDKGAPSPGLVAFLGSHPQLPKGSVCVPGCGTGHDVLAWAEAGFTVTGVDIAPSAVQLATERANRTSLPIRFVQADFLHDPPLGLFDWIWEHTLFCAIHPDQRDSYVHAVVRSLKPGGSYLAVNYLITDDAGPPFSTTREELIERFQPHFTLRESWVPPSYPNRAGRELMLWWERSTKPL